MRRIPIIPTLLLLLAAAATPLRAQDLRVSADSVRLRRSPTAIRRVRLLREGEALTLIRPDSVSGEFLHVLTGAGERGWVHNGMVDRPVLLAGVPILPVVLDADRPAAALDPAWARPPVARSTFVNGATTCGPLGGGGDTITFIQKNRADVPTSYHAVAFAAIGDTFRLPRPHAGRNRSQWKNAAQIDSVARFEGIPVAVVGYIDTVRAQGGSGEDTNCMNKGEANTDWHVAFVEHFDDPESTAVVVEPTPRGKQLHGAKWALSRVRRLENPRSAADSVRISGYLLFDPSHANHLGRFRGTMWEIHPVTRIEIFRDGRWRDLDNEP